MYRRLCAALAGRGPEKVLKLKKGFESTIDHKNGDRCTVVKIVIVVDSKYLVMGAMVLRTAARVARSCHDIRDVSVQIKFLYPFTFQHFYFIFSFAPI